MTMITIITTNITLVIIIILSKKVTIRIINPTMCRNIRRRKEHLWTQSTSQKNYAQEQEHREKEVQAPVNTNVVPQAQNTKPPVKEQPEVKSPIKENIPVTNKPRGFLSNNNDNNTIDDDKEENKINDKEVEDLKQYFVKLRTKITCNEKTEDGKTASSYADMLNKLKSDMMNSKYYNNALDFKKLDNKKSKPNTNKNETLQLNSQFFEINNEKKSTSKTQLLEHVKENNVARLSFSIIHHEKKQVANVTKNAFESTSETQTFNAKQNKPEPQVSYEQQYNDYLREQYNNYANPGANQNKFNKTSNQNNLYSNLINVPSYYTNKQPETGYGMENLYNNAAFMNQNAWMPFGYFPYDRNMFNNPTNNNVDPNSMMMNMFTNYFMNFQQQQPNFYQQMSSDSNYQYPPNVNYKK